MSPQNLRPSNHPIQSLYEHWASQRIFTKTTTFGNLKVRVTELTLTLFIFDGFDHGSILWTHGKIRKALGDSEHAQGPVDQWGMGWMALCRGG